MAHLAANQDPKATHGGNTLARLAGIGVLLVRRLNRRGVVNEKVIRM